MSKPIRPRALVAPLLASTFLALSFGLSKADATCPESCVNSFCSTDPSSFEGSMDLTIGWIYGMGCPGGAASVVAVDEFMILGVGSETPLSFEAKLAFWGSGSPPGHDSGSGFSVTIGDESSTQSTGDVTYYLSGALILPQVRQVGETFTITYALGAGASYGSFDCGVAEANLSFEGLPPGAQVVSCQGYVQEVPVQTLATTWGELKALYR